MAASSGSASAPDSDLKDLNSVGSDMGSSTIQYSMVLEHLIGDKRAAKDLNPGVMGGLPVPAKSDEQKMIERGMESCAFKSVLACVGGNYTSNIYCPPKSRLTLCLDANISF